MSSNADLTPGKAVYEKIQYEDVVALLSKLHDNGFDVIKTENLYEFGGRRGFSLGQGE